MLGHLLDNVRNKNPMIHCITNYVSINDCANILLACGASPIMADDEEEAAEVTSSCDGLYLNIGMLSNRKVSSMLTAGRKANELGHPVVLDPVGVGVSALRRQSVKQLLSGISFCAIRGNLSEIRAIACGSGNTKGVDAGTADRVTEAELDDIIAMAKDLSSQTKAVIVVTGAIDIVADDKTAYCIRNGHPMMRMVSGTGCQLSALLAAYITAGQENKLSAAVAAVCAMGYAGETAYKRLAETDGNAAYRNRIIDAVFNMSAQELDKGAVYEMR